MGNGKEYTDTDTGTDAYTDPKFTRLTSKDGGRPFYYEWQLTVPEGKHGTDVKNFRIDDSTYQPVLDAISAFVNPSLAQFSIRKSFSFTSYGSDEWIISRKASFSRYAIRKSSEKLISI